MLARSFSRFLSLVALFCASLPCTVSQDPSFVHKDYIELGFPNAVVESNNLGGKGPLDGSEKLVFAGIDEEGGYNLEITTSGPYTPHNNEQNGKSGLYGQINVRASTSVDLQVKVTRTKNASFYFTILDLDQGAEHGVFEEVKVWGANQYFVSDGTEVHLKDNKDGSVTVKSGAYGTGSNNPTDSLNLTTDQENRGVAFLFVDTVTFNMTLSARGPPKSTGRNFVFGGTTSLVFRYEGVCVGSGRSGKKTTKVDFTNAVVLENNLGGRGPTHGDEALIYGNVDAQGRRSVDLIVTALSNYTPKSTHANGVNGAYGIINVLAGTDVDLEFKFVDSVSQVPLDRSTFYFSFFDFDSGGKGEQEQVTVHDYSDYYLDDDTLVEVTNTSTSSRKSVLFSSTVFGDEEDNPGNPSELTKKDIKKGVTLYFAQRSRFRANFAATNPNGNSDQGRNIMFSGFEMTNPGEVPESPCPGWAPSNLVSVKRALRARHLRSNSAALSL